MKKTEVYDKVLDIILSHVDVPVYRDEINDDTFLDMIGINSINFIRSVLDIEQLFNFEFEPEYLGFEIFENVGNLINYVESKIE